MAWLAPAQTVSGLGLAAAGGAQSWTGAPGWGSPLDAGGGLWRPLARPRSRPHPSGSLQRCRPWRQPPSSWVIGAGSRLPDPRRAGPQRPDAGFGFILAYGPLGGSAPANPLERRLLPAPGSGSWKWRWMSLLVLRWIRATTPA